MITKKNNNAFLLTHLGLGDHYFCVPIVRYLQTIYDKVYVVCKKQYHNNLKLIFSDDINIRFFPVLNDQCISPKMGADINIFNKLTNCMDIFLAGGAHTYLPCIDRDFPLYFYDHLGIDRKIFWTHFKVNVPEESEQLYKQLIGKRYIVIHNTASNGKVFNSNFVKNKYKNNDDIIFINFNENEYEQSHKYYDLVQNFINKPLLYYYHTIVNASAVYLTDSSFFCLSSHLPIITKDCYYIAREDRSYDVMYSSDIYNNSLGMPRFHQISLNDTKV